MTCGYENNVLSGQPFCRRFKPTAIEKGLAEATDRRSEYE
jgi:hypothetical protein